MTGRSPGVSALKEAFDVTYAVHRMEEEGRRGGGKGFLGQLNEEDEDEDTVMVSAAKIRQANETSAVGNARATGARGTGGVDPAKTGYHGGREGGRAGTRDRGDRKKNFELNMGGATLLGRRNKTPPDITMASV